MVKLFLVEDEIVMRDGIKKHIDWQSEDIEFVGEASDGELAYPMILDLKPDILVTDIKMPFMDGLELTELVKKELPGLHIIILSGYDEFAYAQKAVSLGVTEYLLKPITPTKLLESIKKVQERIEAERMTDREADWSKEAKEERRDIEKLKLFSSIVMNTQPTSEILEMARDLEINLTARHFRIVLLHFGVKGEAGDAFSETRNNFRKALMELLDSVEGWYTFDRGVEGFAILIASGDEKEELPERLDEIIKLVGRYPQAEYFIGVGTRVGRISEIRNTYFEANKAFSRRFLLDQNRVVYAEGPGDEIARPVEKIDIDAVMTNENVRKVLDNFLRTGTPDEVEPFLEGVFHSIGEQNVRSMIFLKYLTMDMYFAMARFVNELGGELSALDVTCGAIDAVVAEMTDAEEAREYLKRYLAEVIKLRDNSSAKRYGRILRKALEYIDENFQREDISLNTVSSVANISPNHFSTVFSQEMGVTFIEYLIKKRMDKARELLMTTDLRSSEIAYQVGYKDPHYFSYTFKKTQGMTTKEYRARGKA